MFDKPTAAIPKTPPSETDGAHGAQPAARPRRPSAGAEHVAAEPSAVRIPNVFDACIEYAVDAWQRSFLYADVMRERGNQYLEHLAQVTPNVLNFEAELVMTGLELARPVNYGLVRIVPPEGIELDPQKRPFVVVDPRAGHGPGIGGFKTESEIGVALRAGHTCYFVGFLPDPVPGQTVEDVMHAEAAFVERVIALHPESFGKPVVIGNCQAGWQILMTAAIRPELFGPIIVAGAPLSYWAGWPGKNPMRYTGGLLGGTWMTALTSDLGAGRFDGAYLVQNFENLNPANTLWTKQYNLDAKVDTERERYLGFERYWGGHVYLNGVEMQYIVDNLFIGNKLATAELVTSDGVRIDLRNIRSPILCFCSKGDNITPPPQALGWITDLYLDDDDVLAHDQTIIYCMHESIGHLGIFVSESVGRKEHQEFAGNIDLLDALPAGIFEAEIRDKGPDTLNPDLTVGNYVLSLEHRGLDDIRRIVQPDVESDRRFAAVMRISETNLSFYRSFVQPWIRAAVTPQAAEWLQRLHPLRVSYELVSDRSPGMGLVAGVARKAGEARKPVSEDNPFLQAQKIVSRCIEASLDQWRIWRDNADELTFNVVYGSRWVQAVAGMNASDSRQPRPHPGVSPEHRAFLAAETERLRAELDKGGLIEAACRSIFYIGALLGSVDERESNLLRQLRAERNLDVDAISLADFKKAIREQARIMRLDAAAAMAALPELLSRAEPADIHEMSGTIERLLTAAGPLQQAAQARLEEIKRVFGVAARPSQATGREGRKRLPTAP
jgi:pimeloyl-ACP methyl ester carboxylesterase